MKNKKNSHMHCVHTTFLSILFCFVEMTAPKYTRTENMFVERKRKRSVATVRAGGVHAETFMRYT